MKKDRKKMATKEELIQEIADAVISCKKDYGRRSPCNPGLG